MKLEKLQFRLIYLIGHCSLKRPLHGLLRAALDQLDRLDASSVNKLA